MGEFWSFVDANPLLVLVAAFTLDSLGIPSVPEITTLLVFSVRPTLAWAATILAIVVAVEVVAGWLLYAAVRRFGLPPWLSRLMQRYSGALVVNDERLLLVNRIFPVLPFAAAFIHVGGWRVRRAFAFVALGSFVKYGVLLLFSGIAFAYLESWWARAVSLGGVVLFMAASWLVARRRPRARGLAVPAGAKP